MSRANWGKYTGIVGMAAALGLSACATGKPTPQLAEAREAYHEASRSHAHEVAPDRLLEAKQALERAEEVHQKSPGSAEERHYAYIAERKAGLAVAHGDYGAAYRNREQAQEQLRELQEQYREQAQARLEKTRDELEETRDSLERVRGEMQEQGAAKDELRQEKQALEQKKQSLQEKLASHESELKSERQARQEAEARAQAALASLEEVAKVKEEARETIITLSGAVLFKTGEADLLPIAKRTLDKVARALKEQSDAKKIVVEGHTDSRGSDSMNRELSLKRAESVRSYLESQGVSSSNLEAVGKGESEPIATNDTPEGRANNRRVEIVIQEN